MKIKYYLSQCNNTISLHCKSPSISKYYVSQLWQSTVGSYTQIICYLFICVALLLIPIFVGWSLCGKNVMCMWEMSGIQVGCGQMWEGAPMYLQAFCTTRNVYMSV